MPTIIFVYIMLHTFELNTVKFVWCYALYLNLRLMTHWLVYAFKVYGL